MIRLFDRNETNFNHNKCVLTPISCFVEEEENGLFELEIELPKTFQLSNGNIIKAPTPRGEQLFRVYRSFKTLSGRKYYARHIFYDLITNFVINVDVKNVVAQTALQSILNACEVPHTFTITSDITSLNSAKYERINPVSAIMNSENDGVISLWGGNLIRNNYTIQLKESSLDRGYEIRMGKNLVGIEDDSDESDVKTRIYPTVELDDEIIALPEKYVDSPLINNYGNPIICEERIELTDEEKSLSLNEIYAIMRNHCNELYSINNIDKPTVNYKIDFVELSKTEQYKNYAILEQLDLYDIVTCKISELDIDVKAKVIKYKYDCLKERYSTIELGDFKTTSSFQTADIVKQISQRIKATQNAVDYATNVITGNKGGYLITRRYHNGKPYEILIMDTEDINTAVNVLRINNSGIGFSQSGYNGPYGTAMTIDGHIVADYMDTGTLTSILLQSVNYIVNESGMKINLADGTIDSKNFKVDSSGNLTANNATLNNGNFSGALQGATGTFSGKITGGELNINNNCIIDTNGNLTANNAKLVNGDFTGSITSNSATITGGSFKVTTSDQNDSRIELLNENVFTKIRPYGMAVGLTYNTDYTVTIDPVRIILGNIQGSYTYIQKDGIQTPALKVNNYDVITQGNISSQSVNYANTAGSATNASYASNSGSSTSCSTGYLTLSSGTLVAPSGSLWIGQNTVKANTIEQLSSIKFKRDIKDYKSRAIDKILNTTIKTYNYKNESKRHKRHVGVIVEESPKEIIGSDGDSIDIYAMTSLAWKAIQELQTTVNDLADRVAALENV